MQVSTLSAQLGLGTELLDWWRDATSVPNGHLLIQLSPCTVDRLRYCTISGSVLSKFYITDRFKHLQSLDHEHTDSVYFSSVPLVFPHMQKPFLLSCPKELIRFLYECIVKILRRNLQSIKRHHVKKLQNEMPSRSLKRITWKQRRDVLPSEKRLQLIKVNTLPVVNHLPWYGAVCSRPCLSIQQQLEFEYSGSYKGGASKISSSTKSHVPNWFAQKVYKQKAVCQRTLFSRQKIVLSAYTKPSNSQTLVVDGVEIGVLLLVSAQQLLH